MIETVQKITDRALLKKLHIAAIQVAHIDEFRSMMP